MTTDAKLVLRSSVYWKLEIDYKRPVLFGCTFAPIHLSSFSLSGEKKRKKDELTKIQPKRTGLRFRLKRDHLQLLMELNNYNINK